MPHGEGPFPAVLALHGHPETAEIFRDVHFGAELPVAGYAVLMLTSRVMAIDDVEHDVSWALLERGFSLMGLRMTEALLGLKVLRHDARIDADHIGLMGHSGGSSTGTLLVRVEPRFQAFVADNVVDWFRSGEDEPYHCETIPELYPLHDQVNDFSTSEAPVLRTAYGFLGALPELLDFFDAHLR